MIRLGSALGYAFRGPESLTGSRPPESPGVFAILASNAPNQYVVIDVGQSDNLREENWAKHPHAPCWADAKDLGPRLFIAYFQCQGRRRDDVERELLTAYEPRCAEDA